jgi:dTDP-4-amino-4,6-dideoxygalactose transaminase
MHYGGVACEMDAILAIGRRHSIAVIEDAAQAITCSYRERPLGSLGDAACVSFDGQKNLTCGEGGALLCSDEVLVERAQTIYDGGTNRAQFVRGEVERYSWVAPGSAFRPSELTAAFLWAQLERAAEIKERRLSLWSHYWDSLAPLEEVGFLRRPHVPSECKHAGHAFWVVLGEQFERSRCLAHLHDRGIEALSHFEPLHSSLAGRTYGRMSNSMSVTEAVAPQLVRLPLHPRMEGSEVDYVVSVLGEALNF